MKFLILNGNDDEAGDDFESYVEKIASALRNNGNEVDLINIRDLTLVPCIGCFGCWLKAAGDCTVEDDSKLIREKTVNCDFLLFASPLVLGMITPTLKRALDKIIPTLMPYMEVYEKAIRHVKRYDKYPDMGIIYHPEDDTDDEDVEILREIFVEVASEFHQSFRLMASTEEDYREVANAINSY